VILAALPFATEPRKAGRSASLFGVLVVGMIVAGEFPVLLRLIHSSVPLTFGVLFLLVAVTAISEYARRLSGRSDRRARVPQLSRTLY
jgi:hypothetical protein